MNTENSPMNDKYIEDILHRLYLYWVKNDTREGIQTSTAKALIKSHDQQIALAAKVEGMELAKSRVLRRTEIPRDAKNPTRDYVVILGEQIAQFIDDDIATLKQAQEPKQ